MKRNKRGSAIIMTLFLVLLAAFAMSRFIEKAYSEILSEALYIERDRLRLEAYSALEATVGVLFDVIRIDGSLYAPSQGWDQPIDYVGMELPEGMEIRVDYVDEMGKISLPNAGRERLLRLFEYLGFAAIESEDLVDALLEWISAEGASQSVDSHLREYERAELPYRPPERPLRSFYELAAVQGFREAFFDGQGVPNALFHELTSLVSLFRFNQVNINSASPAVVRIWSDLADNQVAVLEGYEQREGDLLYFRSLDEASAQLGIPLPGGEYGVATTCLRVNVTVTEGGGSYVLSSVVAPGQGAGANLLPQEQQANQRQQPPRRRPARRQPPAQESRPTDPQAPTVPYPFTFLEIRENQAILELNLQEES